VIEQILNSDFLLLHAMPTLAMALGLIALNLTFLGRMRQVREAAVNKRTRL
jgi:hypothetical protein